MGIYRDDRQAHGERVKRGIARVREAGVRRYDGAPLCIGCKSQPVRPHRGSVPAKQGWRIVDGKRWRWFCGRECAGQYHGPKNHIGPTCQQALRAHYAKARRKHIDRLIALCQPHVTEDGLVPVKALVRAFMAERRIMRSQGYGDGVRAERLRQAKERERVA